MEVAATTTTTPTHELVPQLQFPPGYRFVPTEEELVDVYLRAKIEGRKLPLAVVNDVSILDWQPGKLVEKYKGYGENRWFFFTVREQSSSNKEKEPSRKVRVDGVTATWKATGSVQLIRRSRRSKDGDGDGGRVVVGSKRVLIYNSTDPDENGKWSMHEYILKDHAAIGQYALYSIQRKQHSDTQGNGDMDPEKKKKRTKKRKRTETETPSTELEGVQLPHPETTPLLAEPPLLKPTRKAKVQRRKKPSMQVGVQGEQQKQQQQQGQSPTEPVTPPKKEEPVPSSQQEERQQAAVAADSAPAAADGAPAPVVLSAVPLQAVRGLPLPPSEPDGTLGAPAPTTTEENTLDEMSQLLALLYNHSHHHPASTMLCNNQGHQEQWPPSLADSPAFLAAPDTNVVVGHAPLQPYQPQEDGYSLFGVQNDQHRLSKGEENQSIYMEQGWQHADLMSLMDSTTQLMNSGGSWDSKHGDDQRHHQVHQQQQQQQEEGHNNGGAIGVVQDQKPMNHPQGGHDLQLPPSDEQSSGGSDDLQVVDSLLFGESVQMDELDAFVRGVLHRDEPPPQDLAAATQEGSGDDPATVQAAGTQKQAPVDDTATLHQQDELQRQLALLQLQRALNEHVRDGPCSCMICAAGLWHYYFPGP